jgi:hypothetical protein
MANFFDISDWEEKQYFQTGGTRNKQVVEHPTTADLYFFKTSIKKEKMDYKYEFWSEIIASEVGRYLNLNVLVYDIAYIRSEIGCLSRLMISSQEILKEGINYLRGYNNKYDPEDKKKGNEYTFSFIKETLEFYGIKEKIKDIIKVIIFDSLIGNGDRHQENWGFIISNSNQQQASSIKFSPIYDNGSCLGRKIDDEKINKILNDSNMLNAYINRGKSEIRWNNGIALNHFELIKNIKIKYKEYSEFITDIINKIIVRYDENDIKEIVTEIDSKLPEILKQHKLPQKRKELIIKMLSLRIEQLKNTVK